MRRREDQNFDRQLIGLTGEDSAIGDLPLVHVTAAWNSKEILRTGKFTTKKCKVFDREILYFFVLRPAYKNKIGSEESHQLSRFPVAFFVFQKSVDPPLHAYPFDTGGAADGAFDKQADPYIPLEDYALQPCFKSISEFISWAFGSKASYFYGKLKPDLKPEPFQSVAVSFLDIARMGVDGSNEHDMRASAIEVASSHNVDLDRNVGLIIAPKQFLEGNDPVMVLIEPLMASGAELELYDWQANRAPNEYQSDITRLAEIWLKRRGFL